jgi:hypothetical protein
MAEQRLPKAKVELLERIERARAALDETTGARSEAQLVAPGPFEGWSVKDHLAHLAAWEAGLAALLRKEHRYAAMGVADVDEETALSSDADALNAIIHARTKDRSLADVRGALRDAQKRLLESLAALSDEDLRRTYSHYQTEEPGEDSGAPILRWIAGNSYDHYAEHQRWIEELLAGETAD